MKRYIPIIIIFTVIALLAVSVASAQELGDNKYYQKALELQKKAEDAHARGEYDKAYEYAEEAKVNTGLAAESYAELLLKFRANSLLQKAAYRINSLKTLGVYEKDQDTLDQAEKDFQLAVGAFNGEKYQESIKYSTLVLEALKNVQAMSYEEEEELVAVAGEPTARKMEVAKAPEIAIEAEETEYMKEGVKEGSKVLPKYYRVRLIPERRDCFWRIAEYNFVYGDPFKWRILYEANKSVLVDPENPHLIHPGQIFEIPELEGEIREGTWNPEE